MTANSRMKFSHCWARAAVFAFAAFVVACQRHPEEGAEQSAEFHAMSAQNITWMPPPYSWTQDWVGNGKVVSELKFVQGFPIGYVEVELITTYHNSMREHGEIAGTIVKVPIRHLPAPKKGSDNWWVTSATIWPASKLENGRNMKVRPTWVYHIQDLEEFRKQAR